jgi:hypothetical protein
VPGAPEAREVSRAHRDLHDLILGTLAGLWGETSLERAVFDRVAFR